MGRLKNRIRAQRDFLFIVRKNGDMMTVKTIKVSDVVYREDLYPRIKTDPATVQKYADDLSVLPPVEVNQHNELIDGWHRWTAHKKNELDTIDVIVTPTNSDAHLLELAIEKNATHGLQLSQTDKKEMARRIYHITPDRERTDKKKHLSSILSVSERTIHNWVSRIDKDAKEARNNRIFDKWLACWTNQEIADSEDLTKQAIDLICQEFESLQKFDKSSQAAAEHATDFTTPIYNIWKQQTKSEGVNHFGNSEVTLLDNLLYLYTNPFDVVIDPFGGSGSTIDLCQKRLRRYWVSDRKPIVERENEIRQHDLTNGLPPMPWWKPVKLVYLDPPYWKQAEGQYSDDPEDLSNMSLDDFHDSLEVIINNFVGKLTDAYIALIIQPTQWKALDRKYTDHVAEMLRRINLSIDMRYSVPYESQQCNAQMVEWAKENKTTLVLTREIIVWRIQ